MVMRWYHWLDPRQWFGMLLLGAILASMMGNQKTAKVLVVLIWVLLVGVLLVCGFILGQLLLAVFQHLRLVWI